MYSQVPHPQAARLEMGLGVRPAEPEAHWDLVGRLLGPVVSGVPEVQASAARAWMVALEALAVVLERKAGTGLVLGRQRAAERHHPDHLGEDP